MSGNGIGNRRRTNADHLVVAALAAGRTMHEAAEGAGVSSRTVARRLADPAFRQRVQTLRTEMVAEALGRMVAGMSKSADVLCELLQADSEAIRLGAARTLLDLGLKLRDAVELESRLATLEAQFKGTSQ